MMQNKHLEHPEDSILTGDLSVLNWFTAQSKISIKIDGAPALVFGTNPANGKFFVGTKSVFNKVKIKINHSHEEIDANHEGNVADILHVAFDCLPHIDGIVQGDFIGYGGSDTYCPNTITYKFPEVVKQEFIFAPHTSYVGDTLATATASFGVPTLPQVPNVLWVQPDASINLIREDIGDFCQFARQMSTLCTFVTDRQAKEIKKIINSYIREGKDVNEDEIAENYDFDINLLRLWKLIESIKMDLFCYIDSDASIVCEIDGERSDHEGYVMTNKFGTYKIVNREVFSHQNFVLTKSW
jgi:hypothetical protein